MTKYYRIVFGIVILLSHGVHGVEVTFPGLKKASSFSEKTWVYSIQHRFYGELSQKPVDSFLGMDEGANISMGLGYALTDQVRVDIQRMRVLKRAELSLTYLFQESSRPFQVVGGMGYAMYKDNENVGYLNSGFGFMGISQSFFNDRFSPILNIVYDGTEEVTGMGVGGEWSIDDTYSIIGEWASSLSKKRRYPTLLMGGVIKTFGHSFSIFIHNNHQIGIWNQLRGVQDQKWFLGFEVIRVLEW